MITVGDLSVSLDKREAGANLDFVSHAHSDHISSIKSSKSVFASDITIDLIETIHERRVQRSSEVPQNLRLINAGHIFGSKQIVISDENRGEKIAYTGDFNLQESRACEKIEIEEADIVIVDSTYPHPEVQFEDRGETELAIQKWTGSRLAQGIVLFGAYALGKSQEIISILNQDNIVPVVNKKISRISKVYQKNGMKLDYASMHDDRNDRDQLVRGNFVGIVEPYMLDTIAAQLKSVYNKRVFTAVATGFAEMMEFGTDAQFPLSDHADFKQTVDYIDATGAKKVYTRGSAAKELAENLSEKGYGASVYDNIIARTAKTIIR